MKRGCRLHRETRDATQGRHAFFSSEQMVDPHTPFLPKNIFKNIVLDFRPTSKHDNYIDVTRTRVIANSVL